MKTYLMLTMFLLLLIVTVCLFGCGGSDGTSGTILSTPTPNAVAYLQFKVKWPQSASSEKDLIDSSIPSDTNQITIQIFDIHKNILTHVAIINYPHDETTIYFEKIPAEKIIVRINAYNSADIIPLAAMKKEIKLKAGRNEIAMHFDYELSLSADPNSIVLGGSTVKGSNLISSVFAEPTPAISYITARLIVTSPDMTPSPYPTFLPKEDNIIAQDTNLSGRKIDFTIEEGGGNLSLIDNQETNGSSVTAYTDSMGYCTVKFTTHEEGITKIRGVFQPDPNDPNSIYSDYCNVTVIVPPTPIPPPTETPAPTFTPTPTLTPTITPTPTQTPTPPPFPSYVLGTWKELTGDVKETGNTFTVEFTEPYQYKDHLTKVKIIKNGDSNNAYYGWVWYCDESSGQVYWPEDTTSIMPNSESYYTCFGILYKYKSIVPGASSAICWAKKANGTYMCYWSR